MKKLLAMLGVGVLSASLLVGCGGVDTEKYVGEWSSVATVSEEVPEMGELSVDVTITMTVNEDETYTLEAAVEEASIEELKTATVDAINAQIDTTATTAGVEREEVVAQTEEQLGMTIDEYVNAEMEANAASFAPESLEGAWEVKDETLVLSAGTVDESTLTWDGDSLVLTDETLGEVVFTK